MADDRYILKPLTNEDGKRGYRVEIDEFLADNEMTNLFLIALSELQKDSLRKWDGMPNWLTFYSLAGVHGSPREEWNKYPNNGSIGYCHHASNTFPTWHRPYMMLYESAIHQEMVKQANLYKGPDQKIYLDAAARFRLPFWDLIMPRKEQDASQPGKTPDPSTIWGCPEIFKAAEVFVKYPDGDPRKDSTKDKKGFTSIHNPLGSFVFPKANEWSQHPERKPLKMGNSYNNSRTARVPTAVSKGETDNAAVDLVIQRQAGSCAVLLWQMLNPDEKGKSLDTDKVEVLINEERPWETFANHNFNATNIKGRRYSTVSLESFHDGIHVLLGTGQAIKANGIVDLLPEKSRDGWQGQMGNPAFAAFDPIFWMHHNNIERLFCLYQALYPNKYANSVDSETPLYPFMTGEARTCYKSSDPLVKSYWSSGYAIPGDKPLDATAVRQKVKEYLTNTYYWATNSTIAAGSLPGWPKKLKGSWALYGSDAIIVKAPMLTLSALAVKVGVPELVARQIPLHVEAPAAQDKIIQESEVVKKAFAVDSSLPEGALTGPASISRPPIQLTWNAHIKVRKFAFNGSFSIHLFVGHVKDDQPERYMTKKNEAGFTGVFASSLDSECARCAENQANDIIVEDVVPLTTFLYDYLDATEGSENFIRDGTFKTIPDFDPDHVVPFLKEHLQWRMIDLGANLLVGQEQQAKLEITITSRQFMPPTEGNLMGVYGPYTEYPQITNTKPGGYGYNYGGISAQ